MFGGIRSRKDIAMFAAALIKPVDSIRFFILVATTMSLSTAALALAGVGTMF